MITWSLALPAALALFVGLVGGRLQRCVRPAVATMTCTVLAAVSAVAIVALVGFLGLLFVAQLPFVESRLSWCRALAGHGLPGWIGVTLLATIAAMATSLWRRPRHPRVADDEAHEDLLIVPAEEPTAYALPGRPGRPGRVVVSVGMLRQLSSDERRVLLAHERAHLDRRHDRYLRVSSAAAAVVPLVRPLHRGVRFATERWADEDAAQEVGDRRLVARAICRAALAQAPVSDRAMAMAAWGAVDRVEALLQAPTGRRRRMALLDGACGAAAIIGTTLLLGWQFHHLATVVAHLCGSV